MKSLQLSIGTKMYTMPYVQVDKECHFDICYPELRTHLEIEFTIWFDQGKMRYVIYSPQTTQIALKLASKINQNQLGLAA